MKLEMAIQFILFFVVLKQGVLGFKDVYLNVKLG